MTATLDRPSGSGETPEAKGPKPVISGKRTFPLQLSVYFGVIAPLVALLVAVPFAWGWGLSWVDVGLFVVFYGISGLGITVSYHRYFTHGSFKAKRWLRIALAIAGSIAVQGPVIVWVADHRRHHAFSDRDGDPHSPWLYGTTPLAVAKGFWHAHMGWMFERDRTNAERFAPDLLKDPDIVRVNKLFWLWTLLSAVVIALVAAIGGTEYDVYQRLNLPRIAIGDSTLNTGGAIAGAVAVVATLLFAVLGGKAGERFHKRVDRVATDEYVVER